MSLSKVLREKIGDIIDLIQELSPSRNPLIKIYNAYKHPLSFINKYMRDFPSSSREWAGKIYRAVRYFAEQDEFLPDQGFDTPLDPRLAGKIPSPGTSPLQDFAYRYNFAYTLQAPQFDQNQTFNFWVNSPYLLSGRDLIDLTTDALLSIVDRYKITMTPGQPNSATITATEVQGFVQYIPGLPNA